MKYLIVSIAKVVEGVPVKISPKKQEYYIGNGMWMNDPLKARLHEDMNKALARATDAGMRPGYICGVAEGDMAFTIVKTYGLSEIQKLRAKIQKQEAAKKLKAALGKLTEEEKVLLGIGKAKMKKAANVI